MANANIKLARELNNNSFIHTRYKDTLKRMLSLNLPSLTERELDEAIDYSMNKRYKQVESKVYNNYTEKTVTNTLAELTDYIYSREPICTAWGVLFKKHGVVPNPLSKLIHMFMLNRDKYKGQMLDYLELNDMEKYEEYNLLQLLAKVDTNAIYGALGNVSCIFYNLHVAASITYQGRSYISAAIMFFEMFLSNNVKFASLNEVITFIDNVRCEAPNRHYDDKLILDRDIEPIEVLSQLVLTCGDFRHGKVKWVPDQRDLDIIWEQLNNLSQEDLNRVYYKNNLYAFLDNTSMTKALIYLLQSMTVPYLDPNKMPKGIEVEMDTFCDLLREYVFYNHQIIDRIDRNTNMIKNVSLISDTDSTIVSFDAFYNYVLGKIKGVEIEIAKYYIDGVSYIQDDKNGNPTFKGVYYDPVEWDYDFYNEKVIEKERLIHPIEIIPQDNLRYSIINIIGHCCGILCNEYIEGHTKMGYSYDASRKTMMYLKNEFTFKRTLLTDAKKNYAAIKTLQEGKKVPDKDMNDLGITGLAIKKSTLPKETRDELQKILYEDILKPDYIDQVKLIKDLAIFENKIFESLRSGGKEYYKPVSIKAIGRYEDPLGIQGIKASLIWNAVRDPDLEAIDLDAKNNIDVVKTNINLTTIENIREEFPEEYEKLRSLLTGEINKDLSKVLKGQITTIAVPRNVKTPEWLTHLIDYISITNDNIKNFPVDSVGIRRLGKDNVNYSNILSL